MTEKLFEDQFDDEEVLLVFRKHPVVMRKGLIIASIGLLAGPLTTLILTYVRPNSPPSMNFFFGSLAGSAILCALLFFPYWMAWYYSMFVVTDQRLIQMTQKGFFNRSVIDISLKQIQSLNYEIAGLQPTLLGFGTILIQTYIGDMVIHDVHHPAKIVREISEILRDSDIAIQQYPPTEKQEEYESKD